jgi:hypothetical protein
VPAAIALGTMTFTMSALPGTPALQNAIPMPFFGTTPFAAPGLGIIAAAIMLGFGLWWLNRAEGAARRAGEGYGKCEAVDVVAQEQSARERATIASDPHPRGVRERALEELTAVAAGNDPAAAQRLAALGGAALPFVLPRLDTSYLAEARWGGTSLAAVGGVWAVVVALFAAILTLIALNYRRLTSLRGMDAGASASVLPAFSVARPRRFRRGDRSTSRLRARAGLGAIYRRRSARIARRRHQYPRRIDWVGLRRPHHCPRCAGRNLSSPRVRAWHRPRAAAPRCRDERRHPRQPAA